MNNVKSILVTNCLVALLFSSCLPDNDMYIDEPVEPVITDSGIQDLNIPDGFNYSTKQEVTVSIVDESDYVRYDVYAYTDEKKSVGSESFENQSGEMVTETVYKSDVLRNLVFSGVAKKGKLTQMISIPSYRYQIIA